MENPAIAATQAHIDAIDDYDTKLNKKAKQVEGHLKVFDFENLDEMTDDKFLVWFYGEMMHGAYSVEYHALVGRTEHWVLYDASNISMDYAESLYNTGHWK